MESLRAQDITQVLVDWRRGQENSLPVLMTALQQELHQLARVQFAREGRRNHTLQPTALLSELFLKLQRGMHIDWRDRAHFFAVCATIMRRILTDHARKVARSPSMDENITLSQADALLSSDAGPVDLLDLEAALEALEALDADQHQVVILRFYAGLSAEDVAEVMGITKRTVMRKWAAAKLWLLAYLKGQL